MESDFSDLECHWCLRKGHKTSLIDYVKFGKKNHYHYRWLMRLSTPPFDYLVCYLCLGWGYYPKITRDIPPSTPRLEWNVELLCPNCRGNCLELMPYTEVW